jgi:hypothetical protein
MGRAAPRWWIGQPRCSRARSCLCHPSCDLTIGGHDAVYLVLQILISGQGDYTFYGGNYGSRCTQMVDRAAALQQSQVMFVPSLFWVDDGFMARKSVNSQVGPPRVVPDLRSPARAQARSSARSSCLVPELSC